MRAAWTKTTVMLLLLAPTGCNSESIRQDQDPRIAEASDSEITRAVSDKIQEYDPCVAACQKVYKNPALKGCFQICVSAWEARYNAMQSSSWSPLHNTTLPQAEKNAESEFHWGAYPVVTDTSFPVSSEMTSAEFQKTFIAEKCKLDYHTVDRWPKKAADLCTETFWKVFTDKLLEAYPDALWSDVSAWCKSNKSDCYFKTSSLEERVKKSHQEHAEMKQKMKEEQEWQKNNLPANYEVSTPAMMKELCGIDQEKNLAELKKSNNNPETLKKILKDVIRKSALCKNKIHKVFIAKLHEHYKKADWESFNIWCEANPMDCKNDAKVELKLQEFIPGPSLREKCMNGASDFTACMTNYRDCDVGTPKNPAESQALEKCIDRVTQEIKARNEKYQAVQDDYNSRQQDLVDLQRQQLQLQRQQMINDSIRSAFPPPQKPTYTNCIPVGNGMNCTSY